MALEADWGVLTVLEALRVASTLRFPVPVAFHSLGDEALRNSGTPTRGFGRGMQIGGGKFEIRNSKSEISASGPTFLIPNS